MIETLRIRNYRLFEDLTFGKFSRVNLLVGKNNSGKSCLLEALRIYTAGASVDVLDEILAHRQEDWHDPDPVGRLEINNTDTPARYLFNGYHYPSDSSGAIEIGPVDKKDQVISIMPRYFQNTRIEDNKKLRGHFPVEYDSMEGGAYAGLELTVGTRSDFLTYLYRDSFRKGSVIPRRHSVPKRETSHESSLFVSPNGVPDQKVEKLWDRINITDLEEEVTRCLQLIEPGVGKIGFVGSGGNRKRIPIIRYSGSDERLPLKSLGDGMTRLFHIVLSMVNAAEGYVLIDELENGLHWSIH
ncbi:MAG: AAA family ATPase, partial [bacterium]|nr:AAA family ATPase [bacterium]